MADQDRKLARITIDQISRDVRTGVVNSLGCTVEFGQERAAVLFVEGPELALPVRLDLVHAKLLRLAAALPVAAPSSQDISVDLPDEG
jgi:hypothetical protein